ncbi:hypothetical protein JB92DRAFT_2863017 [Gautieria morchelliformis]|nr:hypothetical protein JB92DRAFT_2863017 [Gautieria morchelliformis]
MAEAFVALFIDRRIHLIMSSQQTQAIIQAISDSIAAKYALVATITLLVFDTLLTLPSESMYIWCRKVRLGTVLYILTRYATLVVFTLELYVSFFEGPLQYGLPSLEEDKRTDLKEGPVILCFAFQKG